MINLYFAGPGAKYKEVQVLKNEFLGHLERLAPGEFCDILDWTRHFDSLEKGLPIPSPFQITEEDLLAVANCDLVFAFVFKDSPSCGMHYELCHAEHIWTKVIALHVDCFTEEDVAKYVERYIFFNRTHILNLVNGPNFFEKFAQFMSENPGEFATLRFNL